MRDVFYMSPARDFRDHAPEGLVKPHLRPDNIGKDFFTIPDDAAGSLIT